MSKVKINEIESLTANGDLTITPNGTGVMEVAGEDDSGALQLNTATQSNKVKIKAPAAAQDYTLVLPTTDIDLSTNKILKVDSITGSGSTAVGQLGYTDLLAQDGANLDASQITSGTLASARIPSPPPAATGAAFKLITTTIVPASTYTYQIDFTLEPDSMYKLITRKLGYSNVSHQSRVSDGTYFQMLNTAGSPQNLEWSGHMGPFFGSGGMYSIGNSTTGTYAYMNLMQYSAGANAYFGDFVMEISTGPTDSSGNMHHAYVYSKMRNRETSTYYQYNFSEMRTSIQAGQSATKEFKTLRLRQQGQDGNYNPYSFAGGSEFRLYQYMES